MNYNNSLKKRIEILSNKINNFLFNTEQRNSIILKNNKLSEKFANIDLNSDEEYESLKNDYNCNNDFICNYIFVKNKKTTILITSLFLSILLNLGLCYFACVPFIDSLSFYTEMPK